MEGDPSQLIPNSQLINNMLEQGRLQFFTAAPLNEDLDRFNALVNDLHTQGEDYTRQLASLSVANLSSGRKESKQSIINFLTDTTNDKTQTSAKNMLLWQARLYLKLAEFYDNEQKVIFDQLDSMVKKQDTLFSELREETDAPFSLTEEISTSMIKDQKMMLQRLKAWSQLFCLGDATINKELNIFITDQPDIFEDVIDKQQTEYFSDLSQPVILHLPHPSNTEDFSITPTPFAQNFHLLYNTLATPNITIDKKLEAAALFNKEVKKSDLTGKQIEFQIQFHFYHNSSLEIFSSYCNKESLKDISSKKRSNKGCLLGLIEQP